MQSRGGEGRTKGTMEHKSGRLLIAAIVTGLVAGGIAVRAFQLKVSFDRTVKGSPNTSEGYDRMLIGKVNTLEEELATRASFGYTGGKDPMTGRRRRVARPRVARPRPKPAPVQPESTSTAPPPPPVDSIRLAAIIHEDDRDRFTAVVMDGERSVSVEVGDWVAGRRITQITNDAVYMENASARFRYGIEGTRDMQRR